MPGGQACVLCSQLLPHIPSVLKSRYPAMLVSHYYHFSLMRSSRKFSSSTKSHAVKLAENLIEELGWRLTLGFIDGIEVSPFPKVSLLRLIFQFQ